MVKEAREQLYSGIYKYFNEIEFKYSEQVTLPTYFKVTGGYLAENSLVTQNR